MPTVEENKRSNKTPSQNTIDNTVAIGQLTVISERTTKDVDRLVQHIEKILPIHEQIAIMKKIVYGSIASAVVFSSWITLSHLALKDSYNSHAAVEKENKAPKKEKEEKIERAINSNRNQITYLKGRIK